MVRITIDIKFEIGDLVYLKTDIDQLERMVTKIIIKENKAVEYCVSLCAVDSWHYGVELTSE